MSDINKYTTKEVLNKVLLDSSGDAVAAFSHTSQEAFNAALDDANSRLNVSLVGGTIGGDVTINGDLTVNGDGAGNYDEIVNGELHVKITDTNAFLVEKADGTDVFTVDTTNSHVGIGSAIVSYTDAITTSQTLSIGENQDSSDKLASVQIIGRGSSSTDTVGALEFINTRSGSGVVSSIVGGRFNGGSASDGNLSFNTKNGSSLTTKMTINDVGNVGIGTSTPAEKLHLKGDGYRLEVSSADYDIIKIGAYGDSGGEADNGFLNLLNDGSEKIKLLADGTSYFNGGNVGIGTSSPASEGGGTTLHIAETGGSTSAVLTLTGGSGGNGSFTGQIQFNDKDDTDERIAMIGASQSGTGTPPGGKLHFYTQIDGGALTEALNLDASQNATFAGNVGINKTATNSLHLDAGNGTAEFGKGITIETGDGNFTANRGGMLEFHNEDVITAGIRAERPTLGGHRGELQFFTHNSSSGNTYGTTFLERMRIDSNGNVGIGTASPVAKLEIQGANGTVSGTPDADGDEFVIRNNNDAGMSILAGESSGHTSSIIFGSTSDLNGANVFYEYNTKTMKLGTQHASGILTLRSANGVTALTLDASQNATFAGDLAFTNDKNISWGTNAQNKIFGSQTGNYLKFYANNGAKLVLDANSRISLSNNNVSGATSNTVFGKLAGDDLEDGGVQNSLFGENAGHGLRTGDENVLLGMDSGALLQNGSRNVGIGKSSANSHATFTDCVVIGQSAEVSANSASNQIVIGRGATGVADNSVSLGNASVTDVYMSTTAAPAAVHCAKVSSISATGTPVGGGFDGAEACEISVGNYNSEIVTTIYVDLGQGGATNIASIATNNAIIGEGTTAASYLTRITTAINGIVYRGEIICLEAANGGDDDINVGTNSVSLAAQANVNDGNGQIISNAGSPWTLSETGVFALPTGGIQDDYVYLAAGAADTAGDYTTGKFLLRFYGASITGL